MFKFKFLIILPILFSLTSCEIKEEEDEDLISDSFACSVTERTTINLAGIDISKDFDENNVPTTSVIFKSSCQDFTEGQSSSSSLNNVKRSGNYITATSSNISTERSETPDNTSNILDPEPDTYSYIIDGTTLTGVSGTVEIENCKIIATSIGSIDAPNDQAIIDDTTTIKGDGCKELLDRLRTSTTSKSLLHYFTNK